MSADLEVARRGDAGVRLLRDDTPGLAAREADDARRSARA